MLKVEALHNARIRINPDLDPLLIGTYWWLRMVDAQSRGEMPVWGGIRIVREERKTASE